MTDVAIIGTGPAGLTAAIYVSRANLNATVFAGIQHGGQLTTTTEVENFPGFKDGITGPELMQEMTAQAERFGAKIEYKHVDKVDFSTQPYKIFCDKEMFEAKAVIIATGAAAKVLGLENEWKLMGKGVSTCATCDGFFYKNKVVAVVGGGDSAMEESVYLSKICKKVYLIHRRDVFRASKIMLDRAKSKDNIEFLIPYSPLQYIHDETGLTGVTVQNTEDNSKKDLKVDGLFIAIGHTPNSEFLGDVIEKDATGYVKTRNFTETNIPGVFAAGDIHDSVFRQAITAAGLGCQAGIQATHYIENQL